MSIFLAQYIFVCVFKATELIEKLVFPIQTSTGSSVWDTIGNFRKVSKYSQGRVLCHTDSKIFRIEQKFSSLTKSDNTKTRIIYQSNYVCKKWDLILRKQKWNFKAEFQFN